MNRSAMQLRLVAALMLGASVCHARPDVRSWSDPVGDAVVRRTDAGVSAPLIPGGTLPDLVSVTLSGWLPTDPVADPYTGSVVSAATADILRLDIVFVGLINPPGPIQFPDEPTRFGPSPLYGFLDFDVDQDIDTGGERVAGRFNYLEEVARFGAVPTGPLADRAVRKRLPFDTDVDFDYYTPPFYERSGADFTLTLCGCTPVNIVSENGNMNGVLDSGETMVVSGTFFQRSAGYQCASFAFGGFEPGLYEPLVNLRFKHNAQTNRTTVSLVFPLTMVGAAILANHPVQQWDFTYGFGNDFSVYEALSDVITAVNENVVSGTCTTSAAHWAGRDANDYLNVLHWNGTALFGSTYLSHPSGASYVWTDVGFAQTYADMNGDGLANATDRAYIFDFIDAYDGTANDADGIVNGAVEIPAYAQNYAAYDVNGDGIVDETDISMIPQICPADWDHQNGLNTSDFFAFLDDFFGGHADFNGDGVTNSADFIAFISAFFAGCP